MDAYIDYQNFCSYLLSMGNKDFATCNEVLLSNFNLYFTFDKKELLNAKKEVKRNFEVWSKSATKNRNGRSNNWNIDFPPRPITENTHTTFNENQLSSIYMIDGENVDKWAETRCLLIATKGRELDVINNLRIEDSFYPTKRFRIRNMTDWSSFGDNSSPCTDIILVDQYVFAQSDSEYDINSYALIEQLSKWAKGTVLNIVIFTLNEYKDGGSRLTVPFITINRNLKEKLTNMIGVEPNITFVVLPERVQHDRTIFTNYKMFTSGDSFKYFKENGSDVLLSTRGEWMYISSLHDADNYREGKDFILDLQEIIDNVKGKLKSIIGDRKSCFLQF